MTFPKALLTGAFTFSKAWQSDRCQKCSIYFAFFHMWRHLCIAHVSIGAHDSGMFKRSLSRGSSIVAALTLVGILSILLVFTQILLPNTNPSSQSAQASTPLPTARPAAAGSSANEVTAQCTKAKKDAAAAYGQPPALNQPFTANVTENNKCIAAIYDEALGNAVKAKSPNTDPRTAPESYKCVGEVTKVTMNAKGQGDIQSTPGDTNSEEGVCKTTFCDSAGKCGPVQNKTGGQSIQTWATESQTVSTLSPDLLKGTVSLGAADAQTQASLNEAFASQIDPQIAAQKAQVDSAQAKLNELQASDDSSRINETRAAQQDLEKQQQQLAALEKQKTDFAANIKQDISQNPGGIDPGGDQPGVASVCAKSGTCVDPNGKEIPKSTFTPPSGGTPAPQTPEKPNTGGGLGDIGKALQGFLGGLAKGLTGAGTPATGAACPSDPSAYAAQQQQYQSQLQQYQYQMQQYQYQQQQMQYQYQVNGYVPVSQPTPPIAPVACTPGATSNTCAAAPPQPATGCGAGYTIKPVTTNQSNGAACTTGWQCAPDGTTAVTPTAQLSCQPQVADVGMSVSLSYGCTNATGSSGSGFATLGATSGSTTTVIAAPPAGSNTATFGLTCTNQNLTGQASCSVQISKPSIVLLANPKVVATSTLSTVGWVTSGMSSCVVSSPQQADFTAANAANKSVNGMATTSPVTQTTDILLHCVTLGGGTRDATTTITVGGAGAGTGGGLTVTSSSDGKSIARGAVNTIQWTATGTPSGSKMSLWLYDVHLGSVTGLISAELAASGSYAWTLPGATDTCDVTSDTVCGTDLVPGRTYGIEADLYTGSLSSPVYNGQAYTPDVFTITQ
ncbi:MAG: hypothetical protein JWM46_246 [Candidatus Kaiserbacteria bacterium]|nr:hypothetical protein [Candidatus Kaiserbacteria bacterium]